MSYFEKLADSFRSIRLWITIDAHLLWWKYHSFRWSSRSLVLTVRRVSQVSWSCRDQAWRASSSGERTWPQLLCVGGGGVGAEFPQPLPAALQSSGWRAPGADPSVQRESSVPFSFLPSGLEQIATWLRSGFPRGSLKTIVAYFCWTAGSGIERDRVRFCCRRWLSTCWLLKPLWAGSSRASHTHALTSTTRFAGRKPRPYLISHSGVSLHISGSVQVAPSSWCECERGEGGGGHFALWAWSGWRLSGGLSGFIICKSLHKLRRTARCPAPVTSMNGQAPELKASEHKKIKRWGETPAQQTWRNLQRGWAASGSH